MTVGFLILIYIIYKFKMDKNTSKIQHKNKLKNHGHESKLTNNNYLFDSLDYSKNKTQSSLNLSDNASQSENQINHEDKNCNESHESWTQSEDLKLFAMITSPCMTTWAEISKKMEDKSISNCMQRWSTLKTNFRLVGAWGKQEQIFLFKLLKKYGFSWKEISEELPLRSSNSIKGFVHASFRKIKKMKKIFWCLNKIARWPTFTNKSKSTQPSWQS